MKKRYVSKRGIIVIAFLLAAIIFTPSAYYFHSAYYNRNVNGKKS